MKRNFILFILFISLYSANIFSQVKDSIIYILPDRVEQKLYEQVKNIDPDGNFNFEFYLESKDKGKFRITFTYKDQLNNYWTNNTNRFVLINKKKYPLIFDYDSLFSTSKPKELGEYGHREGSILRSLFIYEGYNLTFDKTGEYILENLGIYIRKSK